MSKSLSLGRAAADSEVKVEEDEEGQSRTKSDPKSGLKEI